MNLTFMVGMESIAKDKIEPRACNIQKKFYKLINKVKKFSG